MAKYKTEQLENIQIDHGIVYKDYGEVTEKLLGPMRGGATFTATQQVRDIEYDGRNGKSKLQHIDFIDAMMQMNALAIPNEDLEIAIPYLTKSGVDPDFTYTCDPTNLGLVPSADYMKNMTIFAKLTGGGYKKITIYNAMNEAPFSLAAVPKAEGTVNMEVHGHWEVDDTEVVDKLFDITTVASIA